MIDSQQSSQTDQAARRRFQFKIASVLLAMVLISILAAVFGDYFRNPGDRDPKSRFVVLTLVVPTGLLVFFGVLRALFGPRRRRRNKW